MRAVVLAVLALAVPGLAGAQVATYGNSWSGAGFSRFTHVIEAAPGRHSVTLTATTDASGGETVALYPQTASGERGKARIMFVIATRTGRSATGTVTLPPLRRGETVSRLPVMVVVENAGGRPHAGNYTLTVAP